MGHPAPGDPFWTLRPRVVLHAYGELYGTEWELPFALYDEGADDYLWAYGNSPGLRNLNPGDTYGVYMITHKNTGAKKIWGMKGIESEISPGVFVNVLVSEDPCETQELIPDTGADYQRDQIGYNEMWWLSELTFIQIGLWLRLNEGEDPYWRGGAQTFRIDPETADVVLVDEILWDMETLGGTNEGVLPGGWKADLQMTFKSTGAGGTLYVHELTNPEPGIAELRTERSFAVNPITGELGGDMSAGAAWAQEWPGSAETPYLGYDLANSHSFEDGTSLMVVSQTVGGTDPAPDDPYYYAPIQLDPNVDTMVAALPLYPEEADRVYRWGVPVGSSSLAGYRFDDSEQHAHYGRLDFTGAKDDWVYTQYTPSSFPPEITDVTVAEWIKYPKTDQPEMVHAVFGPSPFAAPDYTILGLRNPNTNVMFWGIDFNDQLNLHLWNRDTYTIMQANFLEEGPPEHRAVVTNPAGSPPSFFRAGFYPVSYRTLEVPGTTTQDVYMNPIFWGPLEEIEGEFEFARCLFSGSHH